MNSPQDLPSMTPGLDCTTLLSAKRFTS